MTDLEILLIILIGLNSLLLIALVVKFFTTSDESKKEILKLKVMAQGSVHNYEGLLELVRREDAAIRTDMQEKVNYLIRKKLDEGFLIDLKNTMQDIHEIKRQIKEIHQWRTL